MPLDLGELFGSRFLLGRDPSGRPNPSMYRILPPTTEIKVGGNPLRPRVRANRRNTTPLNVQPKQYRQDLFSKNLTRLLADPKFESVKRLSHRGGLLTGE